VTTSVRHHPIEYLIATGVYWLAALTLGIPAVVVTGHAVTVFAAASITHGNLRLPEWLERSLQPVVITIDLHLIHHSIAYEEANSQLRRPAVDLGPIVRDFHARFAGAGGIVNLSRHGML
jgi:hypothetical protein